MLRRIRMEDMIMVIRKPIGYLLVLLCCFLFSSCGGGGDTAAEAITPTPTPTNTDCVLGVSKIGDCTI